MKIQQELWFRVGVMRSPISSWSMILMSIGFGLTFSANIFGYRLASVQTGLSIFGVVLMLIGLVLSIYNTVAYKRELGEPTIETDLIEGEKILKVFPGGRRITRFSASVGKWCITNQRLIYEGSKPGALGSEPDAMIFKLENLVSADIIKAGVLDKYLEAKFASKISDETVHIIGKKLEEIKEAMQSHARAC